MPGRPVQSGGDTELPGMAGLLGGADTGNYTLFWLDLQGPGFRINFIPVAIAAYLVAFRKFQTCFVLKRMSPRFILF